MPRRLRRSKRRPVGMHDFELQVLCRGFPDRRSDVGLAFMCDVGAQRMKWKRYRDDVLGWWIAGNPGTRPAAWWEFESPEARRRVSGLDGAERAAQVERLSSTYPGVPWGAGPLRRGVPRHALWGDDYETEREYLNLHGLLGSEEAERCRVS